MKKSLFLIPCLAAALWSCSDKDLVNIPDDPTGNGVSETSYLTVNIIPSQTSGTRAEDPTFSTGSATENDVKSIRFYFFDKDRKAVAVKGNGATYYDAKADEIKVIPPTPSAGTNQNIEKVLQAVIVIESPKGDEKPYFMAAVVNYESEKESGDIPVLTAATDSYTKLQETAEDYSNYANGFIMSSSVYKAGEDTYTNDVLSTSTSVFKDHVMVPVFGNIKPTRQEAENNKATIYVERVLAKVSASVNIEDENSADAAKKQHTALDGETPTYWVGHVGRANEEVNENNSIYVQFLGWNVTATRKTSRLVKQLDIATWDANSTNGKFAGWAYPWNDATGTYEDASNNHRSYWAVNPTFTSLSDDYNYGNFGVGTTLAGSTVTAEGNFATALELNPSTQTATFTYLQENAGSATNSIENDELSKIIVGAQLVDKDGNPLELIKWGGDVYRLNDALTAMAAATDLYVYQKDNEVGVGEDKRYKPLTAEDIIITHDVPAAGENASKKTYYVKIGLKSGQKYAHYTYDDAGDKGYYFDDNNGNGYDPAALEDGANEDLGNIMYWKTGYTYYWVNIKHLGGDLNNPEYDGPDSDEPEFLDGIGKYGVVRNHWYQYTFSGVTGLGVPVPDPGETIYPEEPKDPTEFYLAAQIKVLSWNLVVKSESLGW